MKIPVDFSKIPVNEPIPSGIYDLRVTNATLKDTKAGDSQYINVECTVEGGPFDSKKLWMIISLAPDDNGLPKGMWRMQQLQKAFNLEENPEEIDFQDWIGGLFKAEVVTTQDQNNPDRKNVNVKKIFLD